ncbi:hypothetical protein [Bacillus smithii]|uniref:hypothetical protein n=1 Tax=Bacillus smithii TaxID=1479 RepID=UPI003D1A0AB6
MKARMLGSCFHTININQFFAKMYDKLVKYFTNQKAIFACRLIESVEDAEQALAVGACAITISNVDLWKQFI